MSPRTAYLAASLALAAACAPQKPATIEFIATDYAYAAPRTASPGPTLIRFVNRGTKNHEMQFYRFRRGVTPDSAMHLLSTSGWPDSLADSSGSVLTARGGETTPSQIYADLAAGEVWAIECNFRDSVGATRHNAMGMITVLEVR